MNRIIYKITFCFLALCCLAYPIISINYAPATTQKIVSEKSLRDLDVIVNYALESFHVPGVAIGIIIDNKVVLSKGYGYRNLEQKLPVTENTLFPIASCTKAFTTFLLGQLVDEGKINWDDLVINYIPEFSLLDLYTTQHITIRDLVAHRTGLERHDELWLNSQFGKADIIPSLHHLELACSLREKFYYNNMMYAVAGMIIEKVTGHSWEETLSSQILIPLEMHISNTSNEDSQKSINYSLPYETAANEITAITFRDLSSIAPAGAINSCISDMLKWVQLQLSNGIVLDKPLIHKETLHEMHTVQMPIGADPEENVFEFGYGLGWYTGMYRGHYYLNHGGSIDGFISQISLLPQEKIGVIVLSNNGNDGVYLVPSLTNTIIDKLIDAPSFDWIEKFKNKREQGN